MNARGTPLPIMAPKQRGKLKKPATFLDVPGFFDSKSDTATDSGVDDAGNQGQSLRNISMNAFGNQQSSRPTPRLQNTQKTGLGNGNAGANWAFGAPSSGGFGGLGGAPGLGQPRPGQLSGFAQVMGGGGQPQIDMRMASLGTEQTKEANFNYDSDFPSLSGQPRPQQSTAGGWNSAAIRQPATQPHQAPPQSGPNQQQQQRAPSAAPSHHSLDQFDGQRSHPQSTDRGGGGGGGDEQFPPLHNQGPGDAPRQLNGLGSATLGSPDDTPAQVNGPQAQLPIRDVSGTSISFPPAQQAPIGTSQPTSQSQPPSAQSQTQTAPANATAPPVKPWADMTDNERWGLGGLQAMFEARRQLEAPGGQVDETMPSKWRNATLFMGQDLNTLGLDLDSPEPLYPTFTPFPAHNSSGSSYDFKDKHPIPHFTVPAAYTVNNVPPMHTRMGSFSEETLFQCFYTMPGDICQELAACELVTRDWRWHKVLRQWLQKDSRETTSNIPTYDMTNGATPGQQSVRLSETTERGVYVFFNQYEWRRERREFTLDYEHLELAKSNPMISTLNNDRSNGNMAGLDPNSFPTSGGLQPRQNSVISGGA
ncbi:hypothetical protein AC578_2620 [Pseudocercospora eumusae]|uniref:NOT2/NOT3/NOT5 C-terminal domain-containing protein n=2 Tax=Pseudocercospora eumusae TaxID=321146 RepID=A0A139H7V0_9PEZI|nr:hypothetical protein AC578_2620 [Pseudocercospora eumusae]